VKIKRKCRNTAFAPEMHKECGRGGRLCNDLVETVDNLLKVFAINLTGEVAESFDW
jgi:hypothetical protein